MSWLLETKILGFFYPDVVSVSVQVVLFIYNLFTSLSARVGNTLSHLSISRFASKSKFQV